jgi:diguanylate cyclase (GGDEF)-like protein
MSLKDLDQTIAIQREDVDDALLRKSHAALIILQGVEIGRDFRLRRRRTVIGRSPETEIRLHDGQASRQHACIEWMPDAQHQASGYVITDLGSTNRTFVNLTPVTQAALQDGDKILIGSTLLKFVVLDDIEATFHSEIRDRITYDQLTGLLTKESLYLALDRELTRCKTYGLPIAVLMMDLDHFKSINDAHGHLMGSHVLSEVGRLIRDSIRIADASGRYGGEEFISYLAEADTDGARLAAERLRVAIEAHPFKHRDVTIAVTISIGVATAPKHGFDLKTLVDIADRALYQAKAGGRNRVCIAERV